MQKKYRIYHLDDSGKADEILKEMERLEGMHSAQITDHLTVLSIDAEEGRFTEVMDQTVNICRRVSEECELSYLFR